MKLLFGPFSYLLLFHKTKFIIDLVLPMGFTICIFGIRFYFYESTGLQSENGLFKLTIPLVAALSGFYIAALTAISAFPIKSLDEPMPGDKIATLFVKSKNNPSRREFLSLQFGYLACVSILLFLTCTLSIYLENFIALTNGFVILSFDVGQFLKWISLFIVLFFLFNLLTVTLLSVYYLSIKIHEFEPETTGGPIPKVRKLEE